MIRGLDFGPKRVYILCSWVIPLLRFSYDISGPFISGTSLLDLPEGTCTNNYYQQLVIELERIDHRQL